MVFKLFEKVPVADVFRYSAGAVQRGTAFD